MSRRQRLVHHHDRGDIANPIGTIYGFLENFDSDGLTRRRLTTATSFEVEEISILRTG